jgi:hypothetical protein
MPVGMLNLPEIILQIVIFTHFGDPFMVLIPTGAN